MHIHHLSEHSSILNKYISELRDTTVQNDRMRFRRNIERIGEIAAYELSKSLSYRKELIKTPFGTARIDLPQDDLVICSILRAGIPLHNGLLNYFDQAESAFISAFRHHPKNDIDFEIVVEYLAAPSVENKILLLADPMLATGRSLEAVYQSLKELGTPKELHVIAVIAATQGIEFISGILPEDSHLWIATIDKELNNKGYIIPGLGDAGDLAFGHKL